MRTHFREHFAALLMAGIWLPSVVADVTVANILAVPRPGTALVDVYYSVSGGIPPYTVSIEGSTDGGATWTLPMATVSGDIGSVTNTGNNKRITWNAGADWPEQVSTNVKFRVKGVDSTLPPLGSMVLIPAGSFQMGDSFSEGSTYERPVHSVSVSAFYMQNTEVTKAQWEPVAEWANANGYDIEPWAGYADAANHPVFNVTWYDAVKWCNARSQKEGLVPCYYTDAAQSEIYKLGSVDIENGWVKWGANGYRLPTEAEWEKAARGGLSGKRFPWGDTIAHSQANYYSSISYAYDISPTRGFHPTYNGTSPAPAGSFPPNSYGLYEMTGNLAELCWDWYESSYYASSPSSDPRGPASGSRRVQRGGAWNWYAADSRVSSRYSHYPTNFHFTVGFRVARSSLP